MKTQLSILISLLLIGCKPKKLTDRTSETVEIKQKNVSKSSKITPNEIMGIWTNGSTENATFRIDSKSIYYVDDFKDYKYELKGDSIEIHYPDYIYYAEIILRNDTLIMNSKEYNQAKYWKFKE